MVEMVASTDLKKLGVKAGCVITVNDERARVLKLYGKADYAPKMRSASLLPEDADANDAAEGADGRRRRKYQRRDMQAEG